MDKDPILAVAIHAARRAASVLVDVSRDLKRRPSHAKDHADIVMNADTEAENAMIATLRAAHPEHGLVGTAAPVHVSARPPDYLPVHNAMIPKCAGIRRSGVSALDLAYVASGRLDGYWEIGLNPWNVAAGALVVVEAGGRVGDFAGGL